MSAVERILVFVVSLSRKYLVLIPAFLLASAFAWIVPFAAACPFCTAVAPSLSQTRETSEIVALAEVVDATAKPRLRLHRVIKGGALLDDEDSVAAELDIAIKQGQLVLLFAKNRDDGMEWSAVSVNEASAGYFFAAPTLRASEVDRLKYFAPFLEHPDPTIAEDAYREFGHAQFESVANVADRLPSDRVRAWLSNHHVPQLRKGFYGLVLGLATDERDRQTNAKLLEELVRSDDDDFRAGFDGVLGGYLLLSGERGLHLIEKQILANPDARVGDVRHAMTALRFYHEYGKKIPASRLREALAHVLDRPEFAEAAIIDLARWQGWEFCKRIADLYENSDYGASEIRRAIIGYLRACPLPIATDHLARLRSLDPNGVAAAEDVLGKLGRLPQ